MIVNSLPIPTRLAKEKRRKKKSTKLALKGWKKFLKKKRRRDQKQRIRAGQQKHCYNISRLNSSLKRVRSKNRATPKARKKFLGPRPDWPTNIKFLASVPESFSKNHYSRDSNGYFRVPHCFSLMENYAESFDFLKRLFVVLYKGKVKTVTLDYADCKRIDVDASICMDVLLAEYHFYLQKCLRLGHQTFPNRIQVQNLVRKDIINLLFSIGAFRNVRGLTIKKPDDIEPLPVLINTQGYPDIWKKSEVHLTQIVEYIKLCLTRLGKELSIEAETEFYKVIGEVMSNAEEHSTMPHRFAIGYFKEDVNMQDEVVGVLNFTIFNFGDTIYQTFKRPDCLNQKAVKEMSDLSADYTKKGWFSNAEFEEESLWTLYSLQDGVPSKAKKRGNGSIQFLNNFFKLKGDLDSDSESKLVILSGNTRILFDGQYQIVEKVKEGEKKGHKMITFNNSGDITQQPDKKYVTFAPYFFPGTLISARILIKSNNLAST